MAPAGRVGAAATTRGLRPAQSEHDVGNEFIGLIDAWVDANPLQYCTVLDAASVRFAAAHIIMRMRRPEGSRSSSLGSQGAKLAGTLLVLFVHEGFGARGDSDDEPSILGLPMSDLWDMMRDTIAQESLTREAVLAVASAVDVDGRVLELANSHELVIECLFLQLLACKSFASFYDSAVQRQGQADLSPKVTRQ